MTAVWLETSILLVTKCDVLEQHIQDGSNYGAYVIAWFKLQKNNICLSDLTVKTVFMLSSASDQIRFMRLDTNLSAWVAVVTR